MTPYELSLSEQIFSISSHLKKIQGIICNHFVFTKIDLNDWLKQMELEQYFQSFLKQEMFLDECRELDENVLEKLGVTVTGHKLRILKAAEKLIGIKIFVFYKNK